MSHRPPIRFPTTRWSQVALAADFRTPEGRQALEDLLRKYLAPLRSYLLRVHHFNPGEAEETLQAFILGQVLEKELVAAADRSRGRFRTLLLHALDNFVAKSARDAARLKRGGGAVASLDAPAGMGGVVGADLVAGDSASAEPSLQFDVDWARALVADAVRRFHAECSAHGRPQWWGVLVGRVLAPALTGRGPEPYRELVARHGFASPEQAANALVSAKRLFVRCLRSTIAQYARDDAEVDAEIADLWRALSGAGARGDPRECRWEPSPGEPAGWDG